MFTELLEQTHDSLFYGSPCQTFITYKELVRPNKGCYLGINPCSTQFPQFPTEILIRRMRDGKQLSDLLFGENTLVLFQLEEYNNTVRGKDTISQGVSLECNAPSIQDYSPPTPYIKEDLGRFGVTAKVRTDVDSTFIGDFTYWFDGNLHDSNKLC